MPTACYANGPPRFHFKLSQKDQPKLHVVIGVALKILANPGLAGACGQLSESQVSARTGMLDGLDLQGRQRRILRMLVVGNQSNFISRSLDGRSYTSARITANS